MDFKFLSSYSTFTDIICDEYQREQKVLLLMGQDFAAFAVDLELPIPLFEICMKRKY